MESVKTVGGLSISSAPLDFLLELPPDKVAEMHAELLRLGIKEVAIRVTDTTAAAKVETSREQLRRVPVSNDNDKQRVFRRFLPSAIKLGTCGSGQFNVTFLRRTTPNGRETVWITLRKKTCSTSTNPLSKDQKADEAIENRRHNRRRRAEPPPPPQSPSPSTDCNELTNDDNGDERSVTGRACRCATASDCYKNVQALSEYLYRENGGYGDLNVCIFKHALDTLMVYSSKTSGEDIVSVVRVPTTTIDERPPSIPSDDKRSSSRSTVQNDDYPTTTESTATFSLESSNQSSSPDCQTNDLPNVCSVTTVQLCDGDNVTFSAGDSSAINAQKEVDIINTSPVLTTMDSSKCASLTLKPPITEVPTNNVIIKNVSSSIQKPSTVDTKGVNQKQSLKKMLGMFKNKSNKVLMDTPKQTNCEDTSLDGKVTISTPIIAKKSKKGPLGDPFKR